MIVILTVSPEQLGLKNWITSNEEIGDENLILTHILIRLSELSKQMRVNLESSLFGLLRKWDQSEIQRINTNMIS